MLNNILITGGAGFAGSNLAATLRAKYPSAHIVCFDNLIRQGSELNVPRLESLGIEFVHGDIRQLEDLQRLPKMDLIVECSAEPSVLAGRENPEYTLDTNLIGTIHCLQLARRDQADFIFLSTSRVYPIAAINAIPFEEYETRFDWQYDVQGYGYSSRGVDVDFPLKGVRSLYGATKLASEHVIEEFSDMYGLRGVINRLGVIAGPWQMGKIDQGLVSFWIAQHLFQRPLNYIGYGGGGKQVRDVVHVQDVCDLVCLQIEQLDQISGQTFNVGGGRENSFSLWELTQRVQEKVGTSLSIGSVEQDRPSDVRIYMTDNGKVSEALGWSPQRGLDCILEDTYQWMLEHQQQLAMVL